MKLGRLTVTTSGALLVAIAIASNRHFSASLHAQVLLKQPSTESAQKVLAVPKQTSNEARFNALLSQYPFTEPGPKTRRAFQEIHEKYPSILGFGDEGRQAFDGHILKLAEKKDVVVIMEVGVWLGQSVARWVSVSPKVRVIGVDPFTRPQPTHDKIKALPEDIRNQFGQPNFNRALAEYTIAKRIPDASSRVLLLTGLYPEAAEPLLKNPSEGPDVDVFYLDGGKKKDGKTKDVTTHMKFVNNTIRGIIEKFPNVIVAGDDWNWGDVERKAQFQSLLHTIAKTSGRTLNVFGDRTWTL